MGPDDDGDDDLAGFGAPLPPEDRLWRHPSEVRAFGAAAGGPLPPPAPPAPAAPKPLALAAGSALAGALLTVGLLALVGFVSPRVVDHDVVQKVALEPIVSSPMLRSGQGDLDGVVSVKAALEPALVRVDVTRSGADSWGSGVIFRDDGLVLTSADIVEDAELITVSLSNGREYDADLIGRDPLTDLALLDLDGTGFPVAVLGSTAHLEVGQTAVALGSPLVDDGIATVSAGVISALGSTATVESTTLHGLIQTDAAVDRGCAGGALVDATGAVIGITSAAAGGTERGVAYATPIEVARWVAAQLVAHAKVARGWLGVEGTNLPDDVADATGLEGGAYVRDVAEGSPAERLGMSSEDVITKVDDEEVHSMAGLVMELRDHEPGDTVRVTYWRDGKMEEDVVTLDERP